MLAPVDISLDFPCPALSSDISIIFVSCCFSGRFLIWLLISFPIIILIVWIVWGSLNPQETSSNVDISNLPDHACPSGWIYYLGKCYFFSEEERNWSDSQQFCDSQDATLALIKTEPEKAFVLRYMGTVGHWIGLAKDSGQAWKWVDGTEFKNTLKVRGENGDCAYLSPPNFAIPSPCHVARKWICSHLNAYRRNMPCLEEMETIDKHIHE
uniref:C-type lectin domain-containing protein n=1 Tax=Varanus komodoensis TaxID=61221 RepID=A0A8D2L6Z7_VARKO